MSDNGYGDIDWCSVNDGKELGAYELMRKVLYALWWAADKTVNALAAISSLILLFLPSGVKIPIMQDAEVPAFYESLPEQKFWGWSLRLKIPFLPIINLGEIHPLPKQGYKTVFQNWVAPNDIFVGNGEHVWFEDPENPGIWKPGNQYDPVKKYGVFQHMIFDAGTLFLIIAIASILKQIGAFETAKTFLSKLFGTYSSVRKTLKARRMRREIEKLTRKVDVISVGNEFQVIQNGVGVRMKLG
jgi:hypothetical protein